MTTESEREALTQAIAAEVRSIVAGKNLAVKDLAVTLKSSAPVLSRYLNGHREFPLSLFIDLAKALGTDTTAIVSAALGRVLEGQSPGGE
jgi:transcriptional regulator with XRE-family HTH domain